MKAYFFTVFGLFFGIFSTTAQANYNYHSSYEKSIIEAFLDGESITKLDLQLIADAQATSETTEQARSKYINIVQELAHKQSTMKSEERFLSWMFYKVHRKYLKEYQQYTSLTKTLLKGKYDCLSATSLYALLLDELGYNSEVVETTYHVYLKINTLKGNYLIESTDPIDGFLANDYEINARLESLEANAQLKTSVKDSYVFQHDLNNSISLLSMAGLQYYNEAVNAYNNKKLIETLNLLEKSTLFYHSSRIVEFGVLLAHTLHKDETIDENTKYHLLTRISSFLEPSEVIASR